MLRLVSVAEPSVRHSSRKRMKHGKKRKKSRFLDFQKKRRSNNI